MLKDKTIKYWVIAFAILCAIGIGTSIYSLITKPKLGYVYNDRLLKEYIGIKEGKSLYEKKLSVLKSNLDTLGKELNFQVKKYNSEFKTLSKKERELTESLLKNKQEDYMNYKRSVEEQVRDEDQRLSASVLNQINSYIVEYGKKNNYDYILGVGNDGNIFYAKAGGDLTNEIIQGLNKSYKGE